MANDLTNWTRQVGHAGVQTRPTLVGESADSLRRLVVVQNLDREEMKFSPQRQASYDGAEPVTASEPARYFQMFRLRPAG
jgi:hypothetical protein